jgi:cobalt-zinc-cadmium efflux system outer membrane protein
MKRNIDALTLFLISAALLPVCMFGQPSSLPSSSYLDQARGTGIDQLVTQALSQNAELLGTRQRVAEAQGLLRQSGFRTNPAIDLSYGDGAPVGSGANLREMSLGYNHVFELGGKRQRRIEVSEWGVKLAELEIADRERQIRADVKSRYGEALAAIRNLQFTEQLIELNRETLQVTQARVQQGEAPAVDQGLLQVDVGRLESDRTLGENQVLRSVLAIKPLVGLQLDQPLPLQGDLRTWRTDLTLAEALTKGAAARPDLAASRMEQSLRDSEVRASKAEAVPNLVGSVRFTRSNDLFDQYGTNRAGAVTPIRDLDKMLTVGVSIVLPSRNRNQGNIQAAEARTVSARYRNQYLEQVVAQEITSAYRRFEAAQRARSVFEGNVLDRSQDNVRIIRAAYSAGELRLFDVLNEQRRLVDTQRAYTEVLKEYYLSVVELERAVGVPLP